MSFAVDGAPDASGPSKPKRDIFAKRPVWAAKDPTGTASPSDVFGRSSQSYKDILAEKVRKRQIKAEKQVEKENRRDSGPSPVKVESAGRETKRRRITDEDYKAFGIERTPNAKLRTSPGPRDVSESPIKNPSTRGNKEQAEICKPRTAEAAVPVIEIGDSDEEDNVPVLPSQPEGRAQPAPTEHESDEEFPELAAAARERRRQRDIGLQRSATPVGPSVTAVLSRSESVPTPPPAPDPIIKLFVSSPIEGTRPLVVHRKLSQRLQEIREVWCQKQEFTPEMTAKVFLIYKMRKLYDVTTCKSLGIQVDSEGRIIGHGPGSVFQSEDDLGKIAVQVVTEEIFDQMKRDKQLGLQKSASGNGATTTEDESIIPVTRVVLKARGYKDFKIKVKPDTTIERLARAFKSDCKMTDEVKVSLFFDGEELDSNDVIRDTEITDMDCIDVHVREAIPSNLTQP